MSAHQPFDVVFYIADGSEKGKFKHKPYEGTPQPIGVNDSVRLPLRGPWGNSPQPRPVILKLLGTWEKAWENNFVATEEQMACLISTLKQSLPTSLISILTNSNVLFMGYSPSDSDLQLLMNCFWPENRITFRYCDSIGDGKLGGFTRKETDSLCPTSRGTGGCSTDL